MEYRLLARAICAGAMLSGLVGCAAYFPIAQQYRDQAAKDVTFAMVQSTPDAYRDTLVIWGGMIIKTANDTTASELYILQTPLDGEGKPLAASQSEGRFIALTPRFLDPEIYKAGRMITLAGKVAGAKAMPIDNTNYVYPVVKIQQLHIWQPERPHPVYYYWGPAWGWYYDGFWDGFDRDFGDGYYLHGEHGEHEHGERGEHGEHGHGEGHGGHGDR